VKASATAAGAGKVYLVGAGPGAADLLTVRAARLLEAADVVFYDALVDAPVVALAARAQKFAVGKRCGRHSTAQRFINKRLIDAAREGGIVVRLKGGDPMLFGRAQEEIDALTAAGLAVEVVPGITAAMAASAALKVSLTRRGVARNVVLATPRIGDMESRSDWIASAASADTAVIYMGAREAAEIAHELVARGRSPDTPVALVENASLPGERCLFGRLRELGSLASQLGAGPALIVLGDVLGEQLASRQAPVRRAGARTASRKS
jgi:uroporphyrin-III C-methyltransferase